MLKPFFSVSDGVESKLGRLSYILCLMLGRVTRSLKKNRPIFRNVAKTIAKLQKLKLKVENSCIKLLFNVKISATNCVLKLLIEVKF